MIRFLLFGVVLAGFAGCDSGPKTYRVTGMVYWKDQPISEGQISFLAEDGRSSPASSPIKDGKYEVRITEGIKKIEITNQRNKGYDPVMKQDIRTNDIPDEYNANTSLRFEVQPNDDNVYDVKLPLQK